MSDSPRYFVRKHQDHWRVLDRGFRPADLCSTWLSKADAQTEAERLNERESQPQRH